MDKNEKQKAIELAETEKEFFESCKEEKLFDDMVKAFDSYMTEGRDVFWRNAEELAKELKDAIDTGIASKFIVLMWLLKTQDSHLVVWVLVYLMR